MTRLPVGHIAYYQAMTDADLRELAAQAGTYDASQIRKARRVLAERRDAKAAAFFHEHAGWSFNPETETAEAGRIRCARELAKAERDAKAAGLVFSWESDDDADYSWMDAAERAEDHSAEVCFVRQPCAKCGGPGRVIASLGGIFDADANYRRVIEAELAAEAFESGDAKPARRSGVRAS